MTPSCEQLLAGEPAIVVASCGTNAFYLNPMTLEPGEEQIVLDRLKQIIRGVLASE